MTIKYQFCKIKFKVQNKQIFKQISAKILSILIKFYKIRRELANEVFARVIELLVVRGRVTLKSDSLRDPSNSSFSCFSAFKSLKITKAPLEKVMLPSLGCPPRRVRPWPMSVQR